MDQLINKSVKQAKFLDGYLLNCIDHKPTHDPDQFSVKKIPFKCRDSLQYCTVSDQLKEVEDRTKDISVRFVVGFFWAKKSSSVFNFCVGVTTSP